MDAIEAVLELAKERDELASIVESYEEMLESLVGKKVLLTAGQRYFLSLIPAVTNNVNITLNTTSW